MSDTPDVAAEDFVDSDDELRVGLAPEVPEADAIEQAQDVRTQRHGDGRLQIPRRDSPIDDANEADRQEQAEIVGSDEDEETR